MRSTLNSVATISTAKIAIRVTQKRVLRLVWRLAARGVTWRLLAAQRP